MVILNVNSPFKREIDCKIRKKARLNYILKKKPLSILT